MKRGPLLGFWGICLISLGMAISAFFYKGRNGENYSFLNHYVSELGESPWSAASWAFNYGLVVGGILILFFMISLWPNLDSWLGKLVVIWGVVTSMSGSMVGAYPMNNLDRHIDAALIFFYSGLGITMLFSAYVFSSYNLRFPKWMAIPGLISFVCFFVFLFFTDPIIPAGATVEEIFLGLENRPPILETAILEWVVILATLIWILILTIFSLRHLNLSSKG